ncbi:nuclear transport factor 2 family protein [Geodermatophilus sp. SYSU D00079]
MGEAEVLESFRRAVADDDADAMRAGLERLFGLSSGGGLSAEDEYRVRHPDYVMEMPQSGERIRGRDAMRAMQEAFPAPPRIRLRRVVGAGRVWVVEGVNDYGQDDVWHVVLTLELDDDGRIVRDTRYYAQPVEAPAWRARWVEPLG